jgi:hypothetical protein
MEKIMNWFAHIERQREMSSNKACDVVGVWGGDLNDANCYTSNFI